MISDAANQWLATGERGISSEAIFSHMTGIHVLHAVHPRMSTHPRDPSDFWRCRKLLTAVPEFRERLPEMMAISPIWAAVVGAWDELCAMMDTEATDWPTHGQAAPRTYERMKALGC